MKKTEQKKTIFAKPTEPMRWVPSDECRYVDTIDPANTAGLARLREIMEEAKQDKIILLSSSASDLLELLCDLVADSPNADNAVEILRPLAKIMAGGLIKDSKGRHLGGDTMAKRAEAHTKILKDVVVSILKNPATFDWSNPKIAKWLMEPQRAFHKFNGIERGLQTMTDRVKEIREEYKAAN